MPREKQLHYADSFRMTKMELFRGLFSVGIALCVIP